MCADRRDATSCQLRVCLQQRSLHTPTPFVHSLPPPSPQSLLQLGRYIREGSPFGIGTGEGPSKGDCAKHKVTIYNHYEDTTVEVEVPEDRCVPVYMCV